jgi:uncharacterized protein
MIALIASFFSLCVGPLVYQTFGPLKRTDKIVSGIVLVVVAGVIVLEVIPHTFETIGFYALALPLIGFAGPTVIERTFHKAADTTHKFTVYLGILGLLVHAFIDGAAIEGEQQNINNGLTLAIVIHRLPVGLTIWWMLKPLLGEKYALVTLLMMGLATFAGFALNQAIASYHDNSLFAFVQAFIAGSLLHVVFHKPHADGCMHTNEAHQQHAKAQKTHENHSHPHHHDQDHQNKSLSVIKRYVIRWETLGLAIGFAILMVLQYNHQ